MSTHQNVIGISFAKHLGTEQLGIVPVATDHRVGEVACRESSVGPLAISPRQEEVEKSLMCRFVKQFGMAALGLGLIFMAAGQARAQATFTVTISDLSETISARVQGPGIDMTINPAPLTPELLTFAVTASTAFAPGVQVIGMYEVPPDGSAILSDFLVATVTSQTTNIANIQFLSDPLPSVLPVLTGSVTESGGSQMLLTLTSVTGGVTIQINAASELGPDTEPVPEPSSLVLLGLGGLGLVGYAWRRRKQAA